MSYGVRPIPQDPERPRSLRRLIIAWAALLIVGVPMLVGAVALWFVVMRGLDGPRASIITVLALLTVGMVWLRVASGSSIWND